ncbi:acyl-CoA dehydrogenase family protein [Patulibacter americanus]|uniref:acyl-CoA dehydrogenase family protein n=1 Tax=Patulibacter americanus TaxID=588672 RepID=UPI0003B53070|nr:acyl-CoA dehydrogenase family protein [Patulibacter americanus]
MDLSLTDEQVFLRDAARGALSRVDTVAAAREALEDDAARPDLWPTTVEAGWTGLLTSEANGGAELGLYDALLVAQEAGRALAPVPLVSTLAAATILDAGNDAAAEPAAAGELRVAWLPAAPPTDVEPRWTVDPRGGLLRGDLPTATVDGDEATLTGEVSWVPDAAQADALVAVGRTEDGRIVAVLLDVEAAGVSTEGLWRYDPTRPLGHVRLDGARGRTIAADEDAVARAWHVAQAVLAAEAVGTVDAILPIAVAYAKERHTFGRPIGSYQAVKHGLVEILRQLENARSLLMYVAWAAENDHAQLPLAAAAARSGAEHALDVATRQNISVHGGTGATWEHDAPLYFRRAQLSRRLLGGAAGATDRVAGELMAGVTPA